MLFVGVGRRPLEPPPSRLPLAYPAQALIVRFVQRAQQVDHLGAPPILSQHERSHVVGVDALRLAFACLVVSELYISSQAITSRLFCLKSIIQP